MMRNHSKKGCSYRFRKQQLAFPVVVLGLFLVLISQSVAQSPLEPVTEDTSNRPAVEFSTGEKRWLADHPVITIAFDANYPPYSYKNDQGEFVGIAVDIARKVAEKAGFELNIYPNGQWKNLYAAAQAGKVDVIATLVKQGGRENWFEFTRPYLSLSQYIITRNEYLKQPSPRTVLRERKVALIEGYSTTELLLEEIPDIQPYFVSSLQEALEAVSVGHAESTIGDIGMANHLITKSGLTNLGFASLFTKSQSKQRFGIRKDWPELANIMDKSLGAIGYQELMNIYLKWRVPEIVKPEAGFISVLGELTPEERQWLKEHPVIRLASDSAWPPFESIDKSGHYSGIAAEYMKLIEQRLGIKFVHSEPEPWNKVVEKLKNKELDVFSCAMETDARKSFARFTDPYISQPMVIVSKNNVGYIDGLKGLYGKTIAIEESYASYDILQQHHPELDIQAHKDSVSALLSVSSDDAFAYIGNMASISYILRDKGLTDLKVSGQVPYQFALSMGVRDDWSTLVPILQKALDSISLEEKNRILKKWVGVKFEDAFDYRILWQIAALVFVILLLFSYWNYSLNRLIKKRTSELHYQANYDALTALPNRNMLVNELSSLISRANKNNSSVTVLLLDLDEFKNINNALGHQAGDQLLVEVSQRLDSIIEQSDILGRLGGDEFIVCSGKYRSTQDTRQFVERIFRCFEPSFNLGDRVFKLTVSIGITSYPNDGNSISELMRSVDTAMYHAKNLGRNTYSFFDNSMKEKVARRLLLEENMNGALERGEFEVHYQPKIETSTRNVTGFEALLRWNNANLGSVSPVEFISVAENNGLIITIGKFVLDQSLQQLLRWQETHEEPLNMAVNLSPVQFRDEDFVNYISAAIDESGISSNSLELEITEGVLMSGYNDIKQTLLQLKDIGVRLAMDDFGKGYSSLSYLRNYPFDVLKIDREFVSGITADTPDRKLAKATIAMANSLGMKVVAEGVEAEEQFGILSRYGCNYAQGYLFGRPAPADEAGRYLRKT